MKIRNYMILAIMAGCLVSAGCSDALDDDGKSPVLEKSKETHIPGETNTDIPPVVDPNTPKDPSKTDPEVTPVDPPVDPDPVDPPVEPDPVEPEPVEPDPVDPDPVDPDPVEPEEPHDDDEPVYDEVDGIQVLPLTYKPYTTLQTAFRPSIGSNKYSAQMVKNYIFTHLLQPYEKDRYAEFGLGLERVEGEPWILRESLLKASDPDLSHKGKSLAYFWQISDPQIIDEESPCRMEGVTFAPYVVASAYRPQGIFSTHMFDLHVQTARRISDISHRPFDFALVTGDIADNAQENENLWFHRMINGGVLDPDTGIDDDPIEGPNNDYNDPFYSRGLGNIPWYPAIGNHDILYMGFAVVRDEIQAACVGDKVVDLFDFIKLVPNHEYRDGYQNGFQDGSTPEAKVVTMGNTPADPHRRLLSKVESLQMYYDSPGLPVGHGLDPDTIAKGWGYYSTYPMPGKPIRLITLDTNSGEFSEAKMSPEQFDWLEKELKEAKSKNELVIVQSHHGTGQMSGTVNQKKFQELLASYPGVILHITGHGHYNDSNLYVQGERGYWEVMLASVVDFPSQTRVFEIVHEGKGIISIYITNLDMNVAKGTMGYTAWEYAAARKFFGMDDDPIGDWEKEREHRNLILRTRVPEEIYKNLDNYEWSETIESETTLKNLVYNPKNY
ncbi:MAG: metallophosphoesterase [Proteobacteria bacterium]|nr:metallophosphoesterase [Pseudomonadota bacterium]